MITRRSLIQLGATTGALALAGGSSFPVFADPGNSKFVGIQVWDIGRIPGGLKQEVLNAIQAQVPKNDGCMNGFKFASTAGEKLRLNEFDQPGKTPGMRLRGPFRMIVSSVETDPKTCEILNEKPLVDWVVPGGGVAEVPCGVEDVRGRHLRFLFPEELNLKVLYPLIPPQGKMAETRLFFFEWVKTGTTDEWRRMSVHVVVQRTN